MDASVLWLFFLTKIKIKIVWCVVWGGSMNKHHKDACLKEIGLHLHSFVNYSSLNNEHGWKDLCVQYRTQLSCASSDCP